MNLAVSIIIPTFNYATFISEAIESVLNQTFQNFELLVVDDNSQDDTQTIVKQYVDSDKRVKLYHHSVNQGPSAARNTGLKKAKGNYIAFLDGDDIWLPQKLEKQIEILRNESNIGLVNCGGFVINNIGDVVYSFDARRSRIVKELEIDFFYHCSIPHPMSSIMIKRSFIKNQMLFDEHLHYGEDRDFMLELFKVSTYYLLEEKLVKIRKHDNNSQKNIDKQTVGYINFMKKHHKFLPLPYKYHWHKAFSNFLFARSYDYLFNGERKKSIKYHIYSLFYFPLKIFNLEYHIQTVKCLVNRKGEENIKSYLNKFGFHFKS